MTTADPDRRFPLAEPAGPIHLPVTVTVALTGSLTSSLTGSLTATRFPPRAAARRTTADLDRRVVPGPPGSPAALRVALIADPLPPGSRRRMRTTDDADRRVLLGESGGPSARSAARTAALIADRSLPDAAAG